MPSNTVFSSILIINGIILSCITSSNSDIYVMDPENKTTDIFIDFELSFSAPIPDDGLQGMVVLADPEDACEPLSAPPYEANDTLQWFVLIKRYPCALEKKVHHARDAGYKAAIIYNKEPGGPQRLIPNGRLSFSSNAGIPAVLIGYDDGWTIRAHYLYNKGYTVMIYPERPFNISAYLFPFAIVVGSCLFVMILFMIAKCIKDRRRSQRNRLSSRNLKQIPTTKYKKGDQYDVCAICLEEYNEGEKLRILPCSHAYHTKCIDPWLTNNRRTCPVCKRKIALSGCSSESDSDSELESPSETTPLLRNTLRRINGIQSRSSGSGTFTDATSNPNAVLNSVRGEGASSPDEDDDDSRSVNRSQTAQVDFHSSSDRPGLEQAVFDIPDPCSLSTSVNGEVPEKEESSESSSVEIVGSGNQCGETGSASSSGTSKSRSSKRSELVV